VAVAAVPLFGLVIMAVGPPHGIVAAAIVDGMAGAFFDTVDVTMNNEAVVQESVAGRPIMSSFHAFFSVRCQMIWDRRA